jgi:hypothetical protein
MQHYLQKYSGKRGDRAKLVERDIVGRQDPCSLLHAERSAFSESASSKKGKENSIDKAKT